ncbi:AI-2E family transporter [Halobacterium litoreum]|uniref:AI-2E family transporter n=1 Tax=Halobacterium litoreum TaxID=2039234 RepID=A0ABD5NES5_9EURY|nr:AI-2E family transporter [Halobacterium litoreum]UHH13250.1 AI-2E family transporter [Halobacterium litoreum]
MNPSRTTVLAGVLAALLLASSVLLGAVFATVFFAGTVAYFLIPLLHRVERLGLSRWLASAATTALAVLAVVVPLGVALYVASGRVTQLLDALRDLPESFEVAVLDYTYVVEVGALLDTVAEYAATLAVDAASALPVLALKLTLFGVLVFGLLLGHEDAERAFLNTIPRAYHDVAHALGQRATATLYAIYVLQAVTALATAAIALPVFYALGTPFPVTLAVVAGVLQFVPIVGPSLVVGALAVYRIGAGDTTGAVTIVVVAGILVAWLPDVLVRPRLSRETANLPGSLYFIGFTGGLLTVGPVGIIAGPLVVALTVEAANLLADERRANGENGTLEPEPTDGPANPDTSGGPGDADDA